MNNAQKRASMGGGEVAARVFELLEERANSRRLSSPSPPNSCVLVKKQVFMSHSHQPILTLHLASPLISAGDKPDETFHILYFKGPLALKCRYADIWF